jgi:hypothetical protein
VHLILQIDTSTGKLRFKEQFFIFESCGEDISIGVASIRSWLGHPEMANIIFGSKKEDVVSEEETEFSSDVQLFPDPIVHSMNSVHVNSTFPELNKLNKIIEKHSTILFGAFDAQGLKVEPMDIQLKPNCSIKMQPARFINKEIMSKVKDELDRLESWGVLQKIDDAAIASPLVIVRKSDGNIRLAVDYRELNQCIIPSANQLPLQAMLFAQLSHQSYFAKLDCLWGYHQLRLTERAQKYCSIITPWGLYAMKMLGFGISTAPGIYHNRIVNIVGDLFMNGCVVYIDDLIIYGKTIDEFLDRLDRVLTVLAQHNVRLKPSKCFFGFTEILFLGHIFSASGYRLSDDRKQYVQNIAVPTTVKQLKSFLGVVIIFVN